MILIINFAPSKFCCHFKKYAWVKDRGKVFILDSSVYSKLQMSWFWYKFRLSPDVWEKFAGSKTTESFYCLVLNVTSVWTFYKGRRIRHRCCSSSILVVLWLKYNGSPHTLKLMNSFQVLETSVHNNSSFQNLILSHGPEIAYTGTFQPSLC